MRCVFESNTGVQQFLADAVGFFEILLFSGNFSSINQFLD